MPDLNEFLNNPPSEDAPVQQALDIRVDNMENAALYELANALSSYCGQYPCGEICACQLEQQIRNEADRRNNE